MPEIKRFIELSETAKWLASNLLTQVPDEAWTHEPAADIRISICGHEVEDLDEFFQDVANAMDAEIERQAAERSVLRWKDEFDAFETDIQKIRQASIEQLIDSLREAGINIPADFRDRMYY